MLALLLACATEDAAPELSDAEWDAARQLSPPPALRDDPTNRVADDEAAARFGQRLYFDTALSSTGEVSCATCHAPDQGFTDGLELAEGVSTAGKHSPTVLDSARNRWFFWDGRADTAWTQAAGPLENPVEHDSTRLELAHHVAADPTLRAEYEALFGALPALDDTARFPPRGRPIPADVDHPDHVAWAGMAPEDQDAVTGVFVNAAKAIAAYERRLVTGASRFDAYVAGDSAALDPAEVRGLQVFLASNCVLCHSGPELSDREFHNLLLPVPAWVAEGEDYGRYAGIVKLQADPLNGAGAWSDAPEDEAARISQLALGEEQIGQFKTPSLRNVARTAPYMHAGHFASLDEVVAFYSALDEEGGVGHREEFLTALELDEAQQADLVAFLRALDGELPADEWTAAP